jgi:hypothetical protein
VKFEDFSLVSYLSTSTVTRSTWYLDSGASSHMTAAQDLFNSLTEKDSGIHVELGKNAKYAVKGIATISFQLKSGASLEAKDMLYVPGLTKNLLCLIYGGQGFCHQFSESAITHPSERIYP